jgi:hypothetical protein
VKVGGYIKVMAKLTAGLGFASLVILYANRFCANQPFINPYQPHQPRWAFAQNILVRSKQGVIILYSS